MSQAPVSTSGLVRVTVASGTRRVDLVLPGSVPVAELVPELARSVGLLDAATVYGGYRIVTGEGRRLTTDAGLILQGIEDGGLLTITAGIDDPSPRVYDDVVEAMTDVVERDLKPWEPASGRRTALVAAGLLMALGGVALYVQRESQLAGVAAAVVAVGLVAGAVVLSRAQDEPEAAVAVAWMGAAYAALGGLMLAPDGPFFAVPAAGAGGPPPSRASSPSSASATAAPWSSRRWSSVPSSARPVSSWTPATSTRPSCWPRPWPWW